MDVFESSEHTRHHVCDFFQVAEGEEVTDFVETGRVDEVHPFDVFEDLEHGFQVQGLVLFEPLLYYLVQECLYLLEAVAAVSPTYIEVTSLKWFTLVSLRTALVLGGLIAGSSVARLPLVSNSRV